MKNNNQYPKHQLANSIISKTNKNLRKIEKI